MSWPLDEKFVTPRNEAILAFIRREQPSAHDDVASVLTGSAKGLTGVQWYCRGVHRYAYILLHSGDNTIFGIAYGMQALAFRLPPAMIPGAVASGALRGSRTRRRVGPLPTLGPRPTRRRSQALVQGRIPLRRRRRSSEARGAPLTNP